MLKLLYLYPKKQFEQKHFFERKIQIFFNHFLSFGGNFSTGMQKLDSACPEHVFAEILFFGKVRFLLMFFGFLVHRTDPEQFFEAIIFPELFYFFSDF